MIIDKVGDREYWSIETAADLSGYQIIYVEQYKAGVRRLHVVKPETAQIEFRMIYCDDATFEQCKGEWSLPS